MSISPFSNLSSFVMDVEEIASAFSPEISDATLLAKATPLSIGTKIRPPLPNLLTISFILRMTSSSLAFCN